MEVDSSSSSSFPTPPTGFAQSVVPSMNTQQQQHHQQQPPPPPQMSFGLIVPGGPVRTDFVPVDGSGTKFALQLTSPGDLPNPLILVNELVIFLVGGSNNDSTNTAAVLPPNHGVLLYWQLAYQQEQSGYELLGSLTQEEPSHIFRTGWSEHDQFLSLPPGQPVTITIGLSVEPIESVRNVATSTSKNSSSTRPLVAQTIARDLYNFMQSFDTGAASSNGQMLVPQNIFERWWRRFENKSKRDPNFFLKSAD
jgi:hypothetical protein